MGSEQNVEQLATVIMSEAGVGNEAERACVGCTIINRMTRNSTNLVSDVWSAYAHTKAPTDAIRSLATKIMNGAASDPTGGCTHFY